MYKLVSSAQDGCREKSKTVLEIPGNKDLTMFLKLFYEACKGNDDVKRPRAPMCGGRRGEWDCGVDVAKVVDSSWAPVAHI